MEEKLAPWGVEVTTTRCMWRPSDGGRAPWVTVLLYDDGRLLFDHETATSWLSLGPLVWPRLWTAMVAQPTVGEVLHAVIAATPESERTVLRLGVIRGVREVREVPTAPAPDPWEF